LGGALRPEATVPSVPAGVAFASAMPVMTSTETMDRGSKLLYAEPSPEENDFRVLGQFLDSYIVVERRGELLLIDQHNARERVLFERLQADCRDNNAPAAQALFPLLLELTPGEQAALDDERLELFRQAGFDIRRHSGQSIEIKAFPQSLSEGRIRESVRAALRPALPGEGQAGDDDAGRRESLLASLACHDAVKVKQRLHADEMRALVRDLFACANPFHCPHRRPIIVTLTLDEIEKRLKRR
jgi:DNA mismatch repair protein MutL